MDEEYDVVVCGTGLVECVVAGLLSTSGKKVLVLDRNEYYGGEAASLNLTTLFQKYGKGAPPQALGANRDWNVDLIPKFVMACGKLVKILLKTKVTRYLEWKVVDNTYVYQYQAPGLLSGAKYIHKVPANDAEALRSNLMSLLEKNRCKNFFQFIAGWDDANPQTWQGVDPKRHSMAQVYEKFGLQPTTIDFVGHAVALYTNDQYLSQPCGQTIEKIKLYMYSISRYGNSPFIYPLYGLGGLPEGFSRLCAIHGGTFMLQKQVDGFEFDENGRVCGVRSGDEVAKCKMVVCDPSYAKSLPKPKTRATERVVRAICILGEPIPETKNASSCQIIIPQSELKRKSDIYVMMVSSAHQIALRGKYVAIVSTTVETANPEEELRPALNLLGKIEHIFVSVSEIEEPTDDGAADGVYVSKSYDATSHFESTSNNILDLWRRITGEELDLTVSAEPEDLEN